ncbi:hypothetical protein D623_10016548 [Myotis brandtii]|uniref:Uncharacterized protein n=1 Tax=Myotis brandtii TaxID=109478 RepID=S7NSA3_MYOBR|nr:hypothetical protein D623_10016548 [Myotis brandtii]
MKPGRAGCTVALAHTQGHAEARAARTYHWSRENEMMKRMPAGSRAIYTWTSELWPRNQTLHKEVSNPGSQSLLSLHSHRLETKRRCPVRLVPPPPFCRGLGLYNEKEELKSQGC